MAVPGGQLDQMILKVSPILDNSVILVLTACLHGSNLIALAVAATWL